MKGFRVGGAPMRRLSVALITVALAIAFAQIASAADMPTKPPVYPSAAPAVADWSGFYAGVNFGYSVSANDSTATVFVNPAIGLDNNESYKISPAGVLGGVQVGYNWQAGSLLLGAEGDLQATAQKDSVCVVECTNDGSVRLTVDQRLPWLATIRGRVGLVVDRSLLYFTGGAAFGEVKTTVTEVNGPAFVTTVSERKTKSGLTVGGGIESALVGNWTAKIEYLYVDLGSQTFAFVDAAGPPGFVTVTADMKDHVIRGSLNYRFNGPVWRAAEMPVKAPHPAQRLTTWNGLYAGVNLGYGLGRNPTSYFSSTVGQTETFRVSPGGVLGGGQVGYNWQFGRAVTGLETDVQATAMKDSACVFSCVHAFFNLSANVDQKVPWFGTTRARLGYVGDSGALFYVTGGVAYGERKTNINHIQGILTAAVSLDDTKAGWTVGGGIEMPVDNNWRVKAEYLYMDLGSQTIAFSVAPNADVVETSTFRESVFRLGVNYAFN